MPAAGAEPDRAMETAASAEKAEENGVGERARCRSRHPAPAALDGPAWRRSAASGPAGFWRPWLEPRGEEEEQVPPLPAEEVPCGPGMTEDSGKLSQYRHPVRLFWPRSKCYDYLYQEAEALLKNFPIQATISFYEDSDSEDEVEELTCENQSD